MKTTEDSLRHDKLVFQQSTLVSVWLCARVGSALASEEHLCRTDLYKYACLCLWRSRGCVLVLEDATDVDNFLRVRRIVFQRIVFVSLTKAVRVSAFS